MQQGPLQVPVAAGAARAEEPVALLDRLRITETRVTFRLDVLETKEPLLGPNIPLARREPATDEGQTQK